MPAFLLLFAGKLGIPEPFRKAALLTAGVALLLLAAFVAVKIHDHGVIKQHDANQRAATTTADRKADNHAAEKRRSDDARSTQETHELERSANNAQTDVGRRLAFQRCLRLQQSARAAKRQPPTCS